MQLAQTLPSVPRELLKPHGGIKINVLMFISAIALIILSIYGYWLWDWYNWCCFLFTVIALQFVKM
jgi:beta-carotene hydroxylase